MEREITMKRKLFKGRVKYEGLAYCYSTLISHKFFLKFCKSTFFCSVSVAIISLEFKMSVLFSKWMLEILSY